MVFTIGHLVVMYDGVAEGDAWRGMWTIHRPNGTGPGTEGLLILVDENTATELYETREEANSVAEEIARARAEELYSQR